MPRVAQLGLMLALAAGAGFGQRPGGVPPGNPLPRLSPLPPFSGSPRPQFAPQRIPQRGFRSPGYYPFPFYSDLGYYPATYSFPAESAPGGVTIIQQFAPPGPASAEEQSAVTPQIHEYPAPAAPSSGAEPATFAIVLKDGSALSASAVTVQGDALQIVDPDGRHRRVSLDTIDREATRRRNAERNLRLQLPAPSAR
jgi:hypothetical protein